MAVLAFAGVARPAKWAASISYGVYVLHYPILLQTGLAFSLRGLLIGTVALIALAWLTDNRMNRLMQRWARGSARDTGSPLSRFNRT
ncbi:peptidoglycan/LPS O-acetylase OafA/YrhL [Sphingomonas sp. UYAg733]